MQLKNRPPWYNGEWGIAVEFVPRRPIFEKCPHLREKGGVLTLRTPVGFVLTHTVDNNIRLALKICSLQRERSFKSSS